jgi:hypothetical protein
MTKKKQKEKKEKIIEEKYQNTDVSNHEIQREIETLKIIFDV